jgi:hypothetical protein
MKEYPSINKDIRTDIMIYAFDKLDGTNIRAEWSKKRGFYKFGTKKCMLGEDHKIFGESIGLIRRKYEENLAEIFLQEKWDSVTCFFEFCGPNSFSGYHDLTEPHDVTLFDVNVYKQGLLNPSDFIDLFQKTGIPKVLYYGKANSFFIEQVRSSTLDNMTFEGVVCKGKNDKKTKMPIMFKVKSRAWLDKLKTICKDDEKLFQQLA